MIVAGPVLGILLTGPLGAVIGYFGAAFARGAAQSTEALGKQLSAKLIRLLVPDFAYGDVANQDEPSGDPEGDK